VEEKGGRASLIFFGGDARVIDKYGAEYGLPPSGEMLIRDSFTTYSGAVEREPDWDDFDAAIGRGFDEMDGVGIIEMNAMKNSAVVEKKAREIFRKKYDIPVICGHELFNEPNSLRRGASTLLNARLFPVIRSFLAAIQSALAARGVKAPVFIVRSDGSLMSDTFANTRPVETLLCGPAASVLGSAYLSGGQNNIIVDMGGTTTDIALIKNGVPVKATGGVQVGKWKTFVNGLYIKTFGLGGDSAVHFADDRLTLEEYRVAPLCAVADKYPYVADNIQKLLDGEKKHMKFLHEHYLLVRDITFDGRYSREEQLFCSALKAGPLTLREAAESVPGWDMYRYNVSKLLKEGVVQAVGLTPTDIMHITGDFNRYPARAALYSGLISAGYEACMLPAIAPSAFATS
jgi:N-methylhydantoinase A/oxoprolinase/acetone carboxylase beta subunit